MQHIVNTENPNATIITLHDEDMIQPATFDEAFLGYSNAGGKARRQKKRAATSQRKDEKLDAKLARKEKHTQDVIEKKADKQEEREERGSTLGNILTGGVAGALKKHKKKHRAKKHAKDHGGDESGSSDAAAPDESGSGSPQVGTVGDGGGSGDAPAPQSGGGDASQESQGGGESEGEEEESQGGEESAEGSEDESGDGGSFDNESGEDESESGVDGTRNPDKNVRDSVNKIYEGMSIIKDLQDKNAEFKMAIRTGKGMGNGKGQQYANQIRANDSRIANVQAKIEGLKQEVTDYCKSNGISKSEVDYCRVLASKKMNAASSAQGHGGAETPVDKELNPEFGHNKIVINGSSFDGNKTPASTGIIALDDRTDSGYKPTVIEMHSGVDGNSGKHSPIAIIAGLALAIGIVIVLNKTVFKN